VSGAGRWGRLALATAIVAELAAGAGILALRGRETPVTVQDALARYRERTGTTTVPATTEPAPQTVPSAGAVEGTGPSGGPGSPDPGPAPPPAAPGGPSGPGPSAPTSEPAPDGVYVYATSGYEELDVGGARHDYPAESTVTVTAWSCGRRFRWQPLRERWDERDTCPGEGGESLVAFRSHHEFFGRADEREFRCEPGSLAMPASPAPGTTWTSRCRADGVLATTVGRVLGSEPFAIDGSVVEAVHFVLESRLEGGDRGTARYETWATANGVVLRQIAVVDSEARGPVGTVRYRERYELRLRSLTPRR
jgi:hypothetical protein